MDLVAGLLRPGRVGVGKRVTQPRAVGIGMTIDYGDAAGHDGSIVQADTVQRIALAQTAAGLDVILSHPAKLALTQSGGPGLSAIPR